MKNLLITDEQIYLLLEVIQEYKSKPLEPLTIEDIEDEAKNKEAWARAEKDDKLEDIFKNLSKILMNNNQN